MHFLNYVFTLFSPIAIKCDKLSEHIHREAAVGISCKSLTAARADKTL